MKVPVTGFYTKELRSGNSRTGFDVFSLNNNKHAPLARILPDQNYSHNQFIHKVGNYVVDLPSFENIALPSLSIQDNKSVMIIDEIGRMELFSKKFESRVKDVFKNQDVIILATIPNKGKPITLVETLKKLPTAVLIEVDFQNRDILLDKISTSIKNTYDKINKNL
ncbi:cancer-related nucleoside-triphosphatase isoform X2 [Lycorma delicatula]